MTQYFATRRNTRHYYLADRFYLSMLYNKNAACKTLSLHLLNSHSAQLTFTLNFSNCPFVLNLGLECRHSPHFSDRNGLVAGPAQPGFNFRPCRAGPKLPSFRPGTALRPVRHGPCRAEPCFELAF